MRRALCNKCPLRGKGIGPIFDIHTRVWNGELKHKYDKTDHTLFIVEMQPSYQSAKDGRPFSDEAGIWMRYMLRDRGLLKHSHWTSIVKCWSKEKPSLEIQTHCYVSWMTQELVLTKGKRLFTKDPTLDPKLIIALGRDVLWWLLQIPREDLTNIKPGTIVRLGADPIMLMRHPRYVFYHRNYQMTFERHLDQVEEEYANLSGNS